MTRAASLLPISVVRRRLESTPGQTVECFASDFFFLAGNARFWQHMPGFHQVHCATPRRGRRDETTVNPGAVSEMAHLCTQRRCEQCDGSDSGLKYFERGTRGEGIASNQFAFPAAKLEFPLSR